MSEYVYRAVITESREMSTHTYIVGPLLRPADVYAAFATAERRALTAIQDPHTVETHMERARIRWEETA